MEHAWTAPCRNGAMTSAPEYEGGEDCCGLGRLSSLLNLELSPGAAAQPPRVRSSLSAGPCFRIPCFSCRRNAMAWIGSSVFVIDPAPMDRRSTGAPPSPRLCFCGQGGTGKSHLPGPDQQERQLPLHRLRALDPQPAQGQLQLPHHHRRRRQQKPLPRRILFRQDVVPVIEVVELLR